MDNTFREALLSGNPALMAKIPKSDLHNHSLMGCSRHDMEAFYGKPIRPFVYGGNGIHDVDRWIEEDYLPVFRKPGAFETALRSAFTQAKEDGVSVLEMSIDIGIGSFLKCSPRNVAEIFQTVHRETAPDIDFRPDLGIARPLDPARLLPLLAGFLEVDYFRGIDLYDDELSQPAGRFRELYRMAGSAGLKRKAHVGEFGSAESVRETVETLELDVVQHGIAAAASDEVMKWLAERRIPLNICPTSNVILERVSSLQQHPARILFDHGVILTINTDDLIIFGQSVSQEYLNLFRAGVFSAEELEEIRQNGLSA